MLGFVKLDRSPTACRGERHRHLLDGERHAASKALELKEEHATRSSL
jgi:hypothetical protein